MRKILLMQLVLLLIGIGEVCAQGRVVTGVVTDAASGQGLPGVTIVVKGTSTGTSTGVDGDYSISVPGNGSVLIYSFVGYSNAERTVGNSAKMNVTLQVSASQLEEVVVTGYGAAIAKRDVIGAISSVTAKDIENRPIPSFDKALQGKAAGVLVQANNGIPGGAINVRIRGTGSLSAGNQPLYIVDGVQLNTRSDASFTQSNPLSFLNTNDIASIEVLKDAATAAIYGAQAANGVVIITTKKGKAGKTNFTFNTYAGVSEPLKKLKVLNTQDFAQLRAEAWNNQYLDGFETEYKYVLGTELRIPNGANLTAAEIAALPTYDWQDEAMQTGKIQNYELSAGGGNEKTTFYISGSYNINEAIFKKVDFRRGTAKVDLTHKANDKFSISTSLNLSSFSQQAPFATDGTSLGNPAFSSSLIIPSNRVRNDDGSFFGLPGSGQVFPGILNQNIISVNEFNQAYQRNNFVVGNIAASYQIIPGLTFRTFYGLDYRIVQGKSYRDPRTADASARKGLGQVESTWNTNFITTQTLSYDKKIEDHSINSVAGFEYKKEDQEGIYTSADGFPSPQFTYLNSAANPLSASEFYTGFKRISGFGRVNYGFKGKYLLALTARYDGSSRFGASNQFGLFPSVQAGWTISEENFLKSVKPISFLKLRASYGTTGNDQIANFASRGLYGSGALYNGSAGISPTQLPNPELKWEKNQTINLGLDFGFLNDRIAGTLEVYDRQSKDLLLGQPLSWTTGFSEFTSNVGQLQNRGIELELRTTNVETVSGIVWTTNFNIARNKNEVTKLYNGLEVLPSDNSIRVGHPVGTIFTQRYAGVNPATGRPMFLDINDNVTYLPVLADRTIIGDTQPDWYGGLTNNVRYRGFELDFLFQYEYGRIQTDGQLNFLLENGTRALNTLQEVFDNRWTTPGQITSFPRPYNNGVEPGGVNHVAASDRIYNKVDYIRLKNLTLSYNIPLGITQKVKLGTAKVYFQGTNLHTYDDFRGYDPEFFGTATGIIPQSKNYTVGLQLGF